VARKHVTVSLSGDGGDELFGGYARYAFVEKLWNRIGVTPPIARRCASKVLTMMPVERWDQHFGWTARLYANSRWAGSPGDRLHRLAELLDARRGEDLYHSLMSCWSRPEQVVLDGADQGNALTDPDCWAELPTFQERMMYLDSITYLPDDILVKVDRASMAVSLESRIPLLDHRVVEFASRLPFRMKVRDGRGKWLLRQVLYKYVPAELVDRPKSGFGIPVCDWLRGPLREWGEALLDEARLRDEGFFAPEPIRRIWREHLGGERDWQVRLWNVLMFQLWLASEKSEATVTRSTESFLCETVS